MTKFHSPDCSNAKGDRCRCWCNGEFHGLSTGVVAKVAGKEVTPFKADDNEIIMTELLGGEVERNVESFRDRTFKCLGICGRTLDCNLIRGYPHPDGVEDGTGKTWWMYVICPHCQYATALWKILKRLVEVPA